MTEKYFDAVKNIFGVASNEEIISDAQFEFLIQSMEQSRGRKIYFILSDKFPIIAQELIKRNFVFGKDFLNAYEFLSPAQGVPFTSHFLIKAL